MNFWMGAYWGGSLFGLQSVKLLSCGGFLEIRYYSTIMLPSKGLLEGGGAYLQKGFLGGGLFEGGGAYSSVGAYWRIYGNDILCVRSQNEKFQYFSKFERFF